MQVGFNGTHLKNDGRFRASYFMLYNMHTTLCKFCMHKDYIKKEDQT